MSRPAERTVRQSVLDRLIDENPRLGGDVPETWAGSVEGLKISLRRDLEWLLNTRRTILPVPDAYGEVRDSLFRFGLPDITSRSSDSPEVRVEIAREIEETVRLFEPRLTSVRVSVRGEPTAGRQLRFTIDAMLRLDPNPERVLFDTVLDTPTGEFSISGEAHA